MRGGLLLFTVFEWPVAAEKLICLESAEPRLRATLIGYRPLTLTARAGVELKMACSRTRSANRTASR